MATQEKNETEMKQTEEQKEQEVQTETATADAEPQTTTNGSEPGSAIEGEIVDADESVTASDTGATADDAETDKDAAAEDVPAEPTDAEIIEDLRAQLAAAEQKTAEAVDKLQRTAAEFQNSRRRQEKQLSDAIARAGTHTVERLLPVMDDLTLAFNNLPPELDEATNAWINGFRQIGKKLENLLEEQEVSTIAIDGEFDPNRHEAVSSEPSETVESGHIIETLRVGYEHKGRVLRPALVRVAM